MEHQDSEAPPHLKIIVVTYNSAPVLLEFFESLGTTLPAALTHTLVVVDNASSDDTVPMVRARAPEAHVVTLDRNRGFAAGINAGLRIEPTGDAVLVLNPDVRLRPGAVMSLLEALAVPGTGIAVPRMLSGDGQLTYSLRREPTLSRALGEALLGGHRAGHFAALGEVVRQADRYEVPGTADWATGAAMMISRTCLAAVGSWDESFFLYSEETDFALRARDAGFAVRYTPSAEVVHLGGDSSVSPRLWALLTVNRVELYRRRHGAGRTALFWTVVMLNEAIRTALGSPTHAAGLRALCTPLRSRRVAALSRPAGHPVAMPDS